MNLSIAILCGGKSSRMGQEKGLVLWKNKPFIAHIIEVAKSFSVDLFLITNNIDYEKFGFPLFADIYEDKGPVGGIFTAFNYAKNKNILILSCDIPFIQSSIIENLIDACKESSAKATFFGKKEQIHPLIGIYNSEIKSTFKDAILRNELKLKLLIQSIDYQIISISKDQEFQLQNINTLQELNNINDSERYLTLIGAGPGDPDLITVKAIKALKNAKVVLYDALINDDLLDYAPQAKKIFVGKRLGCHAFSQQEINELIVAQVNEFGNVVRLKGGDSFVFGRGSEEIEYAQKFGITSTVIPGITSALAVPASQGISITKRGIAESFWVITGTTSQHNLSNDVALASQSSATVIILMGMHKLTEIVALYKLNRTDNLPIAIIQNGTTVHEKVVVGTIESIENMVLTNNISSPAIIIIGEVVESRMQLQKINHEVLTSI